MVGVVFRLALLILTMEGIGMKDEDRGHKSEKIRIASYCMDSNNWVDSEDGVYTAKARCNLDCFGTHLESGDPGSVRVHFVVTSPIVPAKYEPNGKKRHMEFAMHASMIPMVLAQLDAGKCIATFEHKPNG